MLDLLSNVPPGALMLCVLVGTVFMVGIFALTLDKAVESCRTIPEYERSLKRIRTAAEASLKELTENRSVLEERLAALTQRVAEQVAVAGAKTDELRRAEHKVGTPAIVLDQIILPQHEPWLVRVHWPGMPDQSGLPAETEQWHGGRYFVVFADDAANADRRVNARFTSGKGFVTEPAQPFKL